MKNTGSHIGYLRFGSNAERRKSNGKQRQSEQTVSYLHQGIQKLGMELLEEAKQTCSDPVVLIEQRVDFSRWVEQGFGTSDAILISDGTMHVIDYKHGLGILVSAEDNPQMKCYALDELRTS